jgi:hypothetical protein
MTQADAYVHNFLRECRKLAEQVRLREELRRIVAECKKAADADDSKRARALLRDADRIRAELER